MNPLHERSVVVGGARCRVWEQGEGDPVGFLGGLHGLSSWPPFLERIAARRKVIAPSLPGFPGGSRVDHLDGVADWVTATLDLLEQSGLDGEDLIGASIGGTLAAEVAAFSRHTVERLVLIAPFGLFDEREPVADIWAQRLSELPRLLSAQPDRLEALLAPPPGTDEVEWQIGRVRANEAAARLLWPTCDLGLRKRLHRISAPTLLVWGSDDRVIPASYSKRFAAGISGWVEARSIPGAGHVAEVDQPEAVADAVLEFLA